jgi:GT2 family glycosyltransferase
MLQGGNFILKRSALERIGGFNTNIKFYGEDTDIAQRIREQGDTRFTYDLPMYTSARRLKKEGIVKMGAKYAANYFWTIIFKKPLTKNYQDVRD